MTPSPEMQTAIRQLIAKQPQEAQAQLAADFEIAEMESINPFGSILSFRRPGYTSNPRSGQMPLPVEGVVEDADGALLDVVLYVDPNGGLYELELLRWADGYVKRPNWSTFTVKSPET